MIYRAIITATVTLTFIELHSTAPDRVVPELYIPRFIYQLASTSNVKLSFYDPLQLIF